VEWREECFILQGKDTRGNEMKGEEERSEAKVEEVNRRGQREMELDRRRRGLQVLLHLEHVVVEELLQALVGKIDTELLEAVVFENLETENIKCAYRGHEL
jgi:hypothetical protein